VVVATIGTAGREEQVTLSVVLAGGGTTGHVAPLLALADCLRRRDGATKIVALGTAEGLESRLVPEAGYDLQIVPRVPLPRRPTADLLRLPGKLSTAVAAAAKAIEGVDVVVGFGGYVSAPAYLAARRLGVPIVVHEANARPGVANRLGARFADDVAVTFPGTPLGRRGGKDAEVVGLPLRQSITQLDRAAQRETGRVALNLDSGRPTLLVTGGSLGAQKLNDTFGAAAPVLLDAGVQVLHAAGQGKEVPLPDSARARPYGLPRYEVVEYLERMDLAYAAADLIVCRAGAGSVAEAAAVGLPACFVPLPIGNGEQRFNAAPVVEAGGALMVDNEACTPEWVSGTVVPLLADDRRLIAMGRAAEAFGIRDADERLAAIVEQAARRGVVA
jgi:UDP-N-acetylglucosamine--N-acetylmuramyl-(pentapeptide) pyrophosphoryl-undecaprenol N-acetylglucosamine transferase